MHGADGVHCHRQKLCKGTATCTWRRRQKLWCAPLKPSGMRNADVDTLNSHPVRIRKLE
jgi:hypothetical protein